MLRYIILLLFCIRYNDAAVFEMPIPQFQAFRPDGIRVELPDTPGLTEFFLWGNINVPLEGKYLGSIQLSTYEPTDGIWMIEDLDVHVNLGETIYYTFFVNIDGVVHRYERQQYTVKELVDLPTTAKQTITSTTTPKATTTQVPSTITAGPDKKVCTNTVTYVNLYKDKTVVSAVYNHGNEMAGIQNKECGKFVVVDFSDGEVKFI